MREFSSLCNTFTTDEQNESAVKIFEKLQDVIDGLEEPEVIKMTKKQKWDCTIIALGLVILIVFANLPPPGG